MPWLPWHEKTYRDFSTKNKAKQLYKQRIIKSRKPLSAQVETSQEICPALPVSKTFTSSYLKQA